MPTIIRCPSCDRRLRVPEEMEGQTVRCPACGKTFTAQSAGSASPYVPVEEVSVPEPHDEELPTASDHGRFPQPRRREDDDYEEADDRDDAPRLRRSGRMSRGAPEKPGQVQAIAIMMLIGGIYAILLSVGLILVSGLVCCVWPGTYYSIVLGIMAIVKSATLLGQEGHREAAPSSIAVMQIINIVNGDVINCVLGIISLVFLSDPRVKRYYRG